MIATGASIAGADKDNVSKIYENAMQEFYKSQELQGMENSPYAPNNVLYEMNKLSNDLSAYQRSLYKRGGNQQPPLVKCYPQCETKEAIKGKSNC